MLFVTVKNLQIWKGDHYRERISDELLPGLLKNREALLRLPVKCSSGEHMG